MATIASLTADFNLNYAPFVSGFVKSGQTVAAETAKMVNSQNALLQSFNAHQRALRDVAQASMVSNAATRDRINAEIAAYRQMGETIRAEQRMEAARIQAQISEKGRQDAINRSAQLAKDYAATQQAVATLEKDLAVATGAYTTALEQNAIAANNVREAQAKMASMGPTSAAAINIRQNVRDDFGAAQRSSDIEAYGVALDKLRARFSPIFAASKQYEAVLNDISSAERIGAISAVEAAAARERERMAFEAMSTASMGSVRGIGLSSSAMMNLGYQVNDVVSGLLMGQSPFMILTQQGGQFVQIMQQSGIGPIGLLKQLGSVVRSVVTPAVLAGGALVGVGAATTYVVYQAISNGKAMESALVGVGRGAGVTASQLDALALAGARQANIGGGAARAYAETYAATGRIVGGQIQQLTALTENYGATTHQDGATAAKDLAAAFSNLTTGADALNAKVGFLDASTRQHILDLEAQGNHAAAVRATIDALQPSLIKYGDNLTWLGRRMHDIETIGSNMLSAMEAAPTIAQRVSLLQARIAAASSSGASFVRFEDQILPMAAAQAQVANLGRQLADDMAKAGREARAQYIRNLTLQADDITRALQPGFGQVATMINQLKLLQSLPAETPATTAAILGNQATLAARRSDQGEMFLNGQRYLSDAQMQQQALDIEARAIWARTAAQQAAIAHDRTLQSLMNSGYSAAQREALAQQAAANAFQTANKAISDQIAAVNDNIQASTNAADAWLAGSQASALMAAAVAQANAVIRAGGGPDVLKLYNQQVAQLVSSAAESFHSLKTQAQAQREANAAVEAGTLAHGQLSTFVQQRVRDLGLEALKDAAVIANNQKLIDQINEMIAGYKELDAETERQRLADLKRSVQSPYQDDLDRLKDLRKTGLSPTEVRNGMQDTGLNRDLIGLTGSMAASNPFGAGAQVGLDLAQVQLQADLAHQQQMIDAAQSAEIISAQQALALRAEAEQNFRNNSLAAWQAYEDTKLALGENTFASLATGLGDLFGKQSAAYKAAFAIEKAFQIARATLALEVALAQATTLPWPENIPAIAQAISLGGQILSAIASIGGKGFMAGGYTGNGAVSDIAGVVHGREFVAHADATARNRRTLEAINGGANFDALWNMPAPANDSSRNAPVVNIIHDGSTAVRVEKTGPEEIRLVATQVLFEQGGQMIEHEMSNGNSRGASAVTQLVRPKG